MVKQEITITLSILGTGKMTENSNIEAAGMSASTQPSSPPSGICKNRSAVWDPFDVENAIEKKAKCKYCGSLIQYGNGTKCKQNAFCFDGWSFEKMQAKS
ncbi:hypothetical protein Ahy_B05g077152 [Arachis hypogaea]|uniref:BED-type domain-containing protein n=1 Tax=Arachis hypogaea TaxID=3818 RepID=A0A444Z4W6_ARAHY|nr:hypothetical protein Ahy_B05g077152 [Arachis hypogaea]